MMFLAICLLWPPWLAERVQVDFLFVETERDGVAIETYGGVRTVRIMGADGLTWMESLYT